MRRYRVCVVTADQELVQAIVDQAGAPPGQVTVVPSVDGALALPGADVEVVVLDHRLLHDELGVGIARLRRTFGCGQVVVMAQSDRSELAKAFTSGAHEVVRLDEGGVVPVDMAWAVHSAMVRRRAEPAFLLSSMLDAASDGVLTIDADGIIRRFNPSAEAIYDRSADDVIGLHVSILAHPGARDQQAALLARVLSGETLSPVAAKRPRGGSLVDVELTAAPVRDGHDAIIGACLMIRDVSDQRRVAEEAALADAQFRRAFADSQVPMGILDLEFRYVQVNEALLSAAGRTRDQLVGRFWQGLAVRGDDEARRRLLASGRIYRQVSEYTRPNGQLGWAESVISPIEVAGETVEYLVQMRDVTSERQGEEQLRYFASHDPLTGVFNRRAFLDQLRAHLLRERAEHDGPRGALLMIDLDNFKAHNDTYGHASGDTLLVGIAETMREMVRDDDVIGRLGGDEFVILLTTASNVEAEAVAARLLAGIREYGEMTAPDDGIPVTASLGILELDESAAPEQLLREVDRAVYAAKALGRDRWAR